MKKKKKKMIQNVQNLPVHIPYMYLVKQCKNDH